MIRELAKKIDEFVWGERLQHYGLAGNILRVVMQNLFAVLRDIFSGQLTLRSMSLVYTTLLSVVPLIAFSFAVLKGLGVAEEMPFLAVESRIDSVTRLAKRGHELTVEIRIVLDNEQPQTSALPRA